jgi:hypothetical protein
MRLLSVLIRADMFGFSICPNRSDKHLTTSTVFNVNTKEPKNIVLAGDSLVLHVVALWNISKICKAVICLASIDVINVFSRPKPSGNKPADAMRSIQNAVNSQAKVSVAVSGVADRTSGKFSPSSVRFSPSENACYWIVAKELSGTLNRQFIRHLNLIKAHLVGCWPNGDEPFVRPLKLGQPGDSNYFSRRLSWFC